jgi:hypothetical protein
VEEEEEKHLIVVACARRRRLDCAIQVPDGILLMVVVFAVSGRDYLWRVIGYWFDD